MISNNWLGKNVRIKLFNKWHEGYVVETRNHLCGTGCIVEMYDGNKQIKIFCSIQALKRVK